MNLFSRNITVSGDGLEKEKEYWTNQLAGDLVISGFPIDCKRTEKERTEDVFSCELPQDLSQTILKISKHSEYASYIMLLSAMYYLLYRYSSNDDIMIGSPVYRQEGNAEYLNKVLILRNCIEPDWTFKQLLFQTKKVLDDANDNMNFPLETILELLDKKMEHARIPLFDTMIVCKNLHDSSVIEEYNCDCIFNFAIEEETITFGINYNSQLYTKRTIHQIAAHYIAVLESVTKDPLIKLDSIEILSVQEKEQLFFTFNDTVTEYDKQKTIHQLIEEQVERTPDKTAVQYENDCITYAQLNKRANQLARLLQENGIGTGDTVGLMMPRSVEMIIGVLGILKVNAICVPLDISHPLERTNVILEDSQTKILLKLDGFDNQSKTNVKEIYMSDQQLDHYDSSNLKSQNDSSNTCFLIYTSGSTGKPKGAMLHHYGIINHALTKIKVLDINSYDTVGNNFSINVIASVWQIFAPLFLGAKLVIHSDDIEKDPYLQFERLAQDRITVIELIPSVLSTYLRLIENGKAKIALPELKRIALTSEETKAILVNRFYREYQIQLVDCYGQTECSDDTLHYQIPIVKHTETVLIGTPSNNTRIYIISKDRKLQPVGVPGELCVSGDGLAKGYFRREELTSEKFVENPFSQQPNEKMYRTGDLARWLPDGTVEYLGRIDYQVKIRGYRIELGEIESTLLGHPDIDEAVVSAIEYPNGEKYLCAYFTSKQTVDEQDIITFLKKTTPSYMIPAYFIQMDEFPLMPNGKINKKKLPSPENKAQMNKEYEAPSNELENELVAIYQSILEVDKVGIQDNFFEIGGHSLKAVLLMYEIQKKYGVDITLTQIFTMNTVKKLAAYIQQAEKSVMPDIMPAQKKEYYPLSCTQKRIYLQCQRESIGTSYNMTEALIVEGKIDITKMESIFQQLIERHEILRTSFVMVNGEPMQRIHEKLDFKINFVSLMGEEEHISRLIQPYDLEKAPLMRASLIKVSEEKSILLFDLHHIISDGTSMEVLEKEFIDLYTGMELPELRLQYKDFTEWQNQLLASGAMREKEEFWMKMFEGLSTNGNAHKDIFTDYVREEEPTFEGETLEFELDSTLTDSLKDLMNDSDSTLYIVLLSALNILISKYSGEHDIIIGSPAAGRTNADVNEMLGAFFNMMAIRSYPLPDKTYMEYLKELRDICIRCYENQDYPFTEVIDKMNLSGDGSSALLFNIVFIMQNMNTYRNNTIESLTFKPYAIENNSAKQDLQWEATERDNCIQFILVYNTKLYKKETALNLINGYITLLQNIVDSPNQLLADLQLDSGDDYEEALEDFNAPL